MLRDLDAISIPHAVCHGDLHRNNVTLSGKILDWADAAVTHPFAVLYDVMYDVYDKDVDSVESVDAYLAVYAKYTGLPVVVLRDLIAPATIYAIGIKITTWEALSGIGNAEFEVLVLRSLSFWSRKLSHLVQSGTVSRKGDKGMD